MQKKLAYWTHSVFGLIYFLMFLFFIFMLRLFAGILCQRFYCIYCIKKGQCALYLKYCPLTLHILQEKVNFFLHIFFSSVCVLLNPKDERLVTWVHLLPKHQLQPLLFLNPCQLTSTPLPEHYPTPLRVAGTGSSFSEVKKSFEMTSWTWRSWRAERHAPQLCLTSLIASWIPDGFRFVHNHFPNMG